MIGAVGQIERAVEVWAQSGDRPGDITMRQRAHKVTSVDHPASTSGTLRLATLADVDLVTEWVAEFEAEALAAVRPQSTRASTERRVAAGEMYLWCDPEPRTMAAAVRPTRRAIAVGSVYTPPQWRRRGCATNCVAALSDLLLGRGFEFCVLYTDLANPTSNAIYARIGYRPVRDFLMYELPKPVRD